MVLPKPRNTRRYAIAFILLGLSVFLAIKMSFPQASNLPQAEDIQVYFNQRQTGKQTYTDPYRHIERQGDNLEAIIMEAIASAKSSIDLAIYELNLPNIASALVKSHNSGVKVRVILDNDYSQPLSSLNQQQIGKLNQYTSQKYEEFFSLVDLNGDGRLSDLEIKQRDALVILRDAGISVIDDTADGSKGSGLMHHKFMVIDRQIVITGSANWTLSGMVGDFANPQTLGNVNHLLKIDNTQLANLFTTEFNLMWGDGNTNSKFGLQKDWRSPKTITDNNTTITVQFAPTSATLDWQDSTSGLISRAIATATDSIDLALFVFSEQQLADLLQQKSQQGIKIQALFDPGFAFRYYSEALDLMGVALKNRCTYEANNNPWQQPITSVGIPQLATGDKLHHKFALIDNQIIITGSQNWSPSANTKNDETVLIIDNDLVARHFQQEFLRLYQSASLGLSPAAQSKIQQKSKKCVD